MKTSDIAKEDFKFFKEGGDPGFSPERNKAVVEATIKKHEANIARKNKDYVKQIEERSDVVASYLKSRWAQEGNPIDTYITRELMAQLRGQKRLETIRTLASGKKIITFDEIN